MTRRIAAAAGTAVGVAIYGTFGLEALLFVVQVALLACLYPVGWILTRAAIAPPREWAGTLMALVVDSIVLVVSVFILAAINSGLGSPVDVDVVRSVLRGAFIPLELFGLLFLVAYRRRWFRQDPRE